MIDGDAICPSIAAASVVAKVTRDRIMELGPAGCVLALQYCLHQVFDAPTAYLVSPCSVHTDR